MDRSNFLRLMGAGVGAVALGGCLAGCSKKDTTAPSITVDFTLDLSQAANSALNTNGGYQRTNQVIVARTLGGAYIAVASACTHQGVAVDYNANAHQFHCSGHGANFSESGVVVTGPATNGLQQMNTSLNGQSLRVWS